jgi:hypothetical protein
VTRVYAIISAYNGADSDIESCYFDCGKQSSISMNCVSSGTNGVVGHYRQEAANIRVLEVE